MKGGQGLPEGMNVGLQAKPRGHSRARAPWCHGLDMRQRNVDLVVCLTGYLSACVEQGGDGSTAEPLSGAGLAIDGVRHPGRAWPEPEAELCSSAGCAPIHPWSLLAPPPGVSLLQSSTSCIPAMWSLLESILSNNQGFKSSLLSK